MSHESMPTDEALSLLRSMALDGKDARMLEAVRVLSYAMSDARRAKKEADALLLSLESRKRGIAEQERGIERRLARLDQLLEDNTPHLRALAKIRQITHEFDLEDYCGDMDHTYEEWDK